MIDHIGGVGLNFVNNNFIPLQLGDRGKFTKLNPSTEAPLLEFVVSDSEDVNAAVDAAQKAFPAWKRMSRIARADLFHELANVIVAHQDILITFISLETGKSRNESLAEVNESLHMCRWIAAQGREPCGTWMASEIASKDAYVIRKPKGVVAVISPFNFPLAIGSFWTTGPALLEGNTVVHKPSELSPATAQMMAKLYRCAGFPNGVYNLIHGCGPTGRILVKHPGVKCILFTGSANVGKCIRQVCADSWDKSCSTETGSKSAVVLFDDGNQDLALDVMVASAFKLTGQRCVSSGRLLIQRGVYDSFCDKFVNRVQEQVTLGDPFDETPSYCGPLICEAQRRRVEAFNCLTRESDFVKILLDGKRLDRKGYFLTPHVYKTEWWQEPYLTDEVFGPHVALIPFDDVDDAIRIYNDTEYGLSLGVVTENFRTMRKMRDECRAGMIYLNGGSISAESHLPFGGLNKSGNGMKSAAGTYRVVTDEVAVTVNHDVHIQWAQGMK
jgi:aldehyde dehydrogenase (NAD+)